MFRIISVFDTNISQASVATRLKFGLIFYYFVARKLPLPTSVGERILKIGQHLTKLEATRMWANAQRDGRPAEYRWRPLFNAAKFG